MVKKRRESTMVSPAFSFPASHASTAQDADRDHSSSNFLCSFALKIPPLLFISSPQLRHTSAADAESIRNNRRTFTGDQSGNDRPVSSASGLEPMVEVEAEGRQVCHRHLSIGEHKLPPPICSVSQARRKSMMIIADNFHAMPTLANRGHWIAGGILTPANTSSGSDMLHCKVGKRTNANNVQFALGCRQLIIHARGSDGFLDRFFSPVGAKFAKTDLRVSLDRRQNFQKILLPR
jgi:hypothetical protein